MTLLDILDADPVRGWVEKLRRRDPLPPLVPESEWDSGLSREINDTSHERICVGVEAFDDDMGLALKSGLLLWNDDLESSHVLCQQIKTPTGSYWHGIMHRREPDFGNSKYWFHRVADHPAFSTLAEKAAAYLSGLDDGYSRSWAGEIQAKNWDPFQFVDRCEDAVRGSEPQAIVGLLEKVQVIEIENLLDWCAEHLAGPSQAGN